MPLLTTQSAKGYGFGKRETASTATQAWESIATGFVSSGTTQLFTFSSIPSWAKHIRIIGTALSAYTNTGTGESGLGIYLNGNQTSGAWSGHAYYGNGTTTNRTFNTSANAFVWGNMPWNNTNSLGTAIRGPQIIDIFDIQSTAKGKLLKYTNGFSNRTAGTNQNSWLASGYWDNTAAVTSITISAEAAYADGYFNTNTKFSVYGMRG